MMFKVLQSNKIVTNTVLLMIAGYQTISITLVTKSNAQEKFNEAEKMYDIVSDLPYLDMFIREILRIYSLVNRSMVSECNTTTTVCDHTVEKVCFL